MISIIAIILFILAVLGSLISQTPSLIEAQAMQWLKYLWIFPIGFQLLFDNKALTSVWVRQAFICLLLFISYCITIEMFTDNTYLAVDVLNICMSMMIALASYSFWRLFGSQKVIAVFCGIIVIAGFFLAYSVYNNYLADSSILAHGYAFKNKNSMGQILLCCGFIALVNYKPQNVAVKIAYYLAICFMFLVMILMKARATMVCGFFMIMYYVYKLKNRKLQMLIILLLLLGVGLILINQDLYELIVTGILLANNDVNDINDVSSDRVVFVSEAIELLKDNFIIGVGNYYIDCMPVAMLLQFGILGATFVFILIYIFYYHVTRLDYNNDKLSRTAFVLLLAFLINSLFEAQPPFGPGAKCFLLWVTIGFAFAESEKLTEDSTALTETESPQ